MREISASKRFVAAVALAAYFITNHLEIPAYAAPESIVIHASEQIAQSVSLHDPASIKIPEALGTIAEVHKGAGGRLVVLVQDAHAVPEAQRTIQRLIDFTQKRYGLSLVAAEGAASRLNPRVFRSFPDKELLERTLETFYAKGELAASVAAAILNEKESIYHGIESWPLYEAGLGLYLDALAREGTAHSKLKELGADLNKRKEQAYSQALLALDRAQTAFERDGSKLVPLLERLIPFNSTSDDSEIALILNELKRTHGEGSVLTGEVRELVRLIRPAVAGWKDESVVLAGFNEEFQKFQTEAISAPALALFLDDLARERNLPLKFSASLAQAIEAQRKLRGVKGEAFFKDLEVHLKAAKNSLFGSEAERALDRESRNLMLLEKLVSLELTRDEWIEFTSHVLVPDSLTQLLEPHIAFYQNAEQRESAFYANLTALMSTQSISVQSKIQNPKSAMLIVGGFHARGLAEKLKAENISYALVTPKIGSVPEHNAYRAHMRGDVSWRNYFKVEAGKVDLYEAFVRAVRDKLIEQAKGDSGRMLKRWRDQIIRDLAIAERITEAGGYTRFIDELNGKRLNGNFKAKWLANIDRFIEGLNALEANGRLTRQNVLKLFHPAAAQPAASGPVLLSSDRVNSSLLFPALHESRTKLKAPGTDAAGKNQTRAELRAEDRNEEAKRNGLRDERKRLRSSSDGEVQIDPADLGKRNAPAHIQNLNSKKPAVFRNVDDNPFLDFDRPLDLAGLKLDVQGIRLTIKFDLHGLVPSLQPISGNERNAVTSSREHHFQNLTMELLLSQNLLSMTGPGSVGLNNRFFNLFGEQPSLTDPFSNVLSVVELHHGDLFAWSTMLSGFFGLVNILFSNNHILHTGKHRAELRAEDGDVTPHTNRLGEVSVSGGGGAYGSGPQEGGLRGVQQSSPLPSGRFQTWYQTLGYPSFRLWFWGQKTTPKMKNVINSIYDAILNFNPNVVKKWLANAAPSVKLNDVMSVLAIKRLLAEGNGSIGMPLMFAAKYMIELIKNQVIFLYSEKLAARLASRSSANLGVRDQKPADTFWRAELRSQKGPAEAGGSGLMRFKFELGVGRSDQPERSDINARLVTLPKDQAFKIGEFATVRVTDVDINNVRNTAQIEIETEEDEVRELADRDGQPTGVIQIDDEIELKISGFGDLARGVERIPDVVRFAVLAPRSRPFRVSYPDFFLDRGQGTPLDHIPYEPSAPPGPGEFDLARGAFKRDAKEPFITGLKEGKSLTIGDDATLTLLQFFKTSGNRFKSRVRVASSLDVWEERGADGRPNGWLKIGPDIRLKVAGFHPRSKIARFAIAVPEEAGYRISGGIHPADIERAEYIHLIRRGANRPGSKTARSELRIKEDDPRSFLGTFVERIGDQRTTLTIEAVPPKAGDQEDMRRYHSQLELYDRLEREGAVDAVTYRDAPDFWRLLVLLVHFIWRADAMLAKLFRGPPLERLLRKRDVTYPWYLFLREVNRFADTRALAAPSSYMATIAAHFRNAREIENRILTAVHQQGAKVIFLVSGGHPIRRLLRFLADGDDPLRSFVRRRLGQPEDLLPMNVFKMLAVAKKLQREGKIGAEVQFWVAWNPYKESVDRLERKIDAGAAGVMTQPALLPTSFRRAIDEAHRRGLTKRAQFKFGITNITSARNLRYWFALIGISLRKNEEARQLVRDWERAEAEGRLERFHREWSANFIEWVKALSIPTGFHFMPTFGWRESEILLREAGFAPDDRIEDDRRVPARQRVMAPFIREMVALGVRVSYSGIIESPNATPAAKETGATYASEAEPRIKMIGEVFRRVYEEHPDLRPFFENLRVYINRIRFRNHFRAPVAYRLSNDGWSEIAIDLRGLTGPAEVGSELEQAILTFAKEGVEAPDGINIDPVPDLHEKSAIWQLSDAFWRRYSRFLAATDSQPKASTDLQPRFLEENARQLIEKIKGVNVTRPVYVEVSVAGADRAKRFLNTLYDLATAEERERIARSGLTYVLADFSVTELRRAEQELKALDAANPELARKIGALGISFEYQRLQAEDPVSVLEPYQGRILVAHATNLYDAIRTNFIAQYERKPYAVLAQAYLPKEKAAHLAEKFEAYGITVKHLRKHLPLIREKDVYAFLRVYRKLIRDEKDFYRFWQELFDGILIRESYVQLSDRDQHEWADLRGLAAPQQAFRDVLKSHPRNVWVPDSKYAVQGALSLVPLLHPKGIVQMTQFGVPLTKIHQDFEGLRKLGGAIAAPIFWSLFKETLLRMGYSASWKSFADYDGKSKTIMTIEVAPASRAELRLAPVGLSTAPSRRSGEPREELWKRAPEPELSGLRNGVGRTTNETFDYGGTGVDRKSKQPSQQSPNRLLSSLLLRSQDQPPLEGYRRILLVASMIMATVMTALTDVPNAWKKLLANAAATKRYKRFENMPAINARFEAPRGSLALAGLITAPSSLFFVLSQYINDYSLISASRAELRAEKDKEPGQKVIQDTDEDLIAIDDPMNLPDGRMFSELSHSELLTLLKSPYPHVSAEALEILRNKGTVDALDPLEAKAEELERELASILKAQDQAIRTLARVDGKKVGGFELSPENPEVAVYLGLKAETEDLLARIHRILDVIYEIRKRNARPNRERIAPPPLDRISEFSDSEWRLRFLNEPFDFNRTALDSFLKGSAEALRWEDLAFDESYYFVKEKTFEFPEGPKPVIYVRKFDVLKDRETGRQYFTSDYELNEMFAMMAGYLFYDLLGLPVRHTRVIKNGEGKLALVRRYFKNGSLFQDYRFKFGKALEFNEDWRRVLRGSLLVDQVIGYTDRDESNLFVAVTPEGEHLPIFVDMKFSFGNPQAGSEIQYDFSKFVIPQETGVAPQAFAYNPYHSAATASDLEWMAVRLEPVTEGHIDQIVRVVDEQVPGHTFDLDRLRAEWKKSLLKAKQLYGRAEPLRDSTPKRSELREVTSVDELIEAIGVERIETEGIDLVTVVDSLDGSLNWSLPRRAKKNPERFRKWLEHKFKEYGFSFPMGVGVSVGPAPAPGRNFVRASLRPKKLQAPAAKAPGRNQTRAELRRARFQGTGADLSRQSEKLRAELRQVDEAAEKEIVQTIWRDYRKYYLKFKLITQRAKKHFENRRWQEIQDDFDARFRLYHYVLNEAEGTVRKQLGEHANNRKLWDRLRERYLENVRGEYDADLALTFFYSVMRRIFSHNGEAVEYSDDGIAAETVVKPKEVYREYKNIRTLGPAFRSILRDLAFDAPFVYLRRSSRRVGADLKARLIEKFGTANVDKIQVLQPIFFRNKAAYAVGRVYVAGKEFPFVIALLNGTNGIYVDAVLTDDASISNIFTSARSNFHVDIESYRELIAFLKEVLPSRTHPYLYSAIGFEHPAKIDLIQSLRKELAEGSKKFERPSGARGSVMEVFSLEDFPFVFKVIRDHSEKPYFEGRETVLRRYQKVHEIDRVGRLLDTMTFYNLSFSRDKFPEDLLSSLVQYAPSSVVLKDNEVVFRHIYAQRKVPPLLVYLNDPNVAEGEKERVIVGLGYAIKDLLAAGIFLGDYLLQNFGVTQFGRVVAYDFDELEPIASYTFREIPPPRDEMEEMMHLEDRIAARDDEFYPEQLIDFLVPARYRNLFYSVHGDLLRAQYWSRGAEKIERGEIPDSYPYSEAQRLIHRFYRRSELRADQDLFEPGRILQKTAHVQEEDDTRSELRIKTGAEAVSKEPVEWTAAELAPEEIGIRGRLKAEHSQRRDRALAAVIHMDRGVLAQELKAAVERKWDEISIGPNLPLADPQAVQQLIRSWIKLVAGRSKEKATLAFELNSEWDASDVEKAVQESHAQKLLELLILTAEGEQRVQVSRAFSESLGIPISVRHKSALESLDAHLILDQHVLPVVSKRAHPVFANLSLVGIGVRADEYTSDPYLDLAVSVLQIVSGLLVAERIKNRQELQSPEVRAALLRELFLLDQGNVIQFNDSGLVVSKASLRLHLNRIADQQIRTAA